MARIRRIKIKRDKSSSLFLDLIFVFTFTSILALIVAFATPYWFKADPNVVSNFLPGTSGRPGVWIDSFGLWMYCYRRANTNPLSYWQYSVDCRSFFTRFDVTVLIPIFFLATQVIYTIGLGIACIALLLFIFVDCCCGRKRRWVAAVSGLLLVSAVLISIAVIIFGAATNDMRGASRTGIFGSRNQDTFWSFWLAVAGVCMLWICVFAGFIEFCLIKQRQEIEELPEEIYTVNTVYIPSEGGYVPFTSV